MTVNIPVSDQVWAAFSKYHQDGDPEFMLELLLREATQLPPYDAETLAEDRRRFEAAERDNSWIPHEEVMASLHARLDEARHAPRHNIEEESGPSFS